MDWSQTLTLPLLTNGGAMEAVQGSYKIQSTQPISGTTPGIVKATTTDATGGNEFDLTLKALLSPDRANNISEEELFSGLVQERIKKTKGDAALEEFNSLLKGAKERLKRPDGFVPVEDATKEALKNFLSAQKISATEADAIYSQAFAAAQLDQNKEALFDGRGGPNDPTMAVAQMEQALLMSRAAIEKIDAGTETVTQRSLLEASNVKLLTTGATAGHTSEAGSGFLFKPVSDSDRKLAILLPPRLAGLVQGVDLISPSGDKIESGRYAGNGNGGRDHFRFTRPGGDYSDGLNVEVRLTTGEVVRYKIPETSARTENISPAGGTTEQGTNTAASGDTSGSKSPGNSSL